MTILRCLSEPSFMFVTHCQERNLWYFTQKSLLGGGGWVDGGIAIIESAPGLVLGQGPESSQAQYSTLV